MACIADLQRISLMEATPAAKVYLVKSPNDGKYYSDVEYPAPKGGEGARRALDADIETLKTFEHSSFARIYHTERDKAGATHLLTNYHELGSLAALIEGIAAGYHSSLAEGDVLRLAVDLLLAVKYAHERRKLALRLSPACVLLARGLRAKVVPVEGIVRRLESDEDRRLDLWHVGTVLAQLERCLRSRKFSVLLGALRDGLLQPAMTVDKALHLPAIVDRFVLLEDVDRLRKLGQGNFGTTYLARHKTDNRQFALKEIYVSNNQDVDAGAENPDFVDEECAILASISHKNIVAVYHAERVGRVYSILMELCSGGDLQSLIDKGPVDEPTALRIMSQVCVAVEHLHRRKVLHRDLKPANIFLKAKGSDEVRVGDFGLSKQLAHTLEMARTQCGTPAFFSPELLVGQAYGPGADVWAAGLIFYILLAGQHPFVKPDGNLNLLKLSNGEIGHWPAAISPESKAIVRACLEPDPSRRPNISQVLSMRGLRGLAPEEHGHSDRALFVPAKAPARPEGAKLDGNRTRFDRALSDAWGSEAPPDFGETTSAAIEAAGIALGMVELKA